ncbi:OLC1v1010238C1 [Oldenlandia corymbosa var. corymbosa]|uniref:OLC1v1010238C1 n=1 Tax=Oldenlandia corymbosa var. corymbosa TaxID=529605 RepID=A0AAV1DTK7_OLDCO|nr:OLC1v1010238C1 [Oldenlandia corymbosa var. corymbosa]
MSLDSIKTDGSISTFRHERDPRIQHARALRGFKPHNVFLLNSILALYSKSNLNHYSLRVFNSIPRRNVVSWTTLISAFSHSAVSFHHFVSMVRESTLPNSRTFATLLTTCASLPSSLPFALQLHSLAHKLSCNSDPFTGSALVSFYCKVGSTDDARKAFDEMADRDKASYGSIVNGIARNGNPFVALSYFGKMIGDGVGSSYHSVSGALKAVSELALLEQCRVIHGHAVVAGWDMNVVVGTALINAYCKCGFVEDARGVFDELETKLNVMGWNAMMAGYAQQGYKDHVLELFGLMEERGLEPDDYSFLALLTALSNAGAVEQNHSWIRKMRVDYMRDPGIEHYTCLIASLGRAGQLEEAERVASTMPLKPDAAVWRVLLSSSAYHGNVDMAQKMSRKLSELVPDSDSADVILLNAFANAGRWDDVKDTLARMEASNVRRHSGKSRIEVQGQVHEFIFGDRKHERSGEIYKKLAELMEEIEKLGYVPVWDEMLHDVNQAQKKGALWSHSEKLALAFAVLSGAATPPGKVVRIVKNLRTCRDCHQAFKYFSIVLKREILVRDVNRYHKFSNGSCSCGDYW